MGGGRAIQSSDPEMGLWLAHYYCNFGFGETRAEVSATSMNEPFVLDAQMLHQVYSKAQQLYYIPMLWGNLNWIRVHVSCTTIHIDNSNLQILSFQEEMSVYNYHWV